MASWQARLAAYMVRRRVKPALGDMSDIGKVRSVFATRLPSPSGVRYRPATLGGVPGEWVEADAPGTAACTLLYLHGGGFVGCSPQTHRPLTAALALQGMRLFVPDYRLAPEHPFPAALDDVRAAWDALRADVAAGGAGRLAVAGDSAGGNLALALMLSLRDAGQPLPDVAALFSPSTDLTGASPSLLANAARDAMFDGAALGRLADAYLAGGDPAQALASPLLADLAGLPPLLVHVGENEVLRDDGLRLADKARAAGVQIELAVFDVVPHVWQLFWRLPEAKRSVREAARFLRSAGGPDNVPVEDVIIVGAGLSGIGAACHLQTRCPGKRLLILEGRESMGGTWDLFRYPGVRSDSDMYTLGYAFRPWTQGKAIADGPAILDYIRDTARAYGVDRKIRYGQQVKGARWSTADACWTLDVAQPDGRVIQMRCNFLFMCAGYYRYAEGYRPAFPGEERYAGRIVHPQHWTPDIDYRGQARGRHRQRRDRDDAGAQHRGAGRACDHAAALADLCGGPPRQRRARQPAAQAPACNAGIPHHPLEERVPRDVFLSAEPTPAGTGQAADDRRRQACARAGLRCRHPFHAVVQAVGPARMPGARRRPVRRLEKRPRQRRHRPYRPASPKAACC